MISYKEFKNLMQKFINTREHLYSCAAYKGQSCCLENENILNYIYSLFEEKVATPSTSRIKCCGE
jgi:hypothetical protein